MLRKILVSMVSLIIVALLVAFGIGPGYLEKGLNRVIEHETYVISDEARALHATLVAADLHSDTLLWHRDVLDRGERGHVDVPRLVEGGVAVQVFSTVTKAPKSLNYDQNTGDSDQIFCSAGRYAPGEACMREPGTRHKGWTKLHNAQMESWCSCAHGRILKRY